MFSNWLVRLIIVGFGLLSAVCYAQTSTCGVTTQTAQFNFRNIDEPAAPTGVFNGGTLASGINNSGMIVGTFFGADGQPHGYSDNVDLNSFRQIDFPGSPVTSASGVNERGDIVGFYDDSNGAAHGFLLRDGNFTTIDFPNAIFTLPMGINDSGVIAGFYLADGFHAFILDNKGFTTIDDPNGVLNGFQTSQAFTPNDRGQVVGAFTDSNFNVHGFLFSGGAFQTIDFPGAFFTSSNGLNNKGIIVGQYVTFSPFISAGYIQQGTSFTTVEFPGAVSTALVSITSTGLIVGQYSNDGFFTHSFLTELPSNGNSNNAPEQQAGCLPQPQRDAAPLPSNAPQSCRPSAIKGRVVCSPK